MALHQSEMSLLQPSASIGTSKKSKKQTLREISQQKHLRGSSGSERHVKSLDPVQESDRDDTNLVGTSWRKKKRKRRKLKVEKVILDPKPPPVHHEVGDGESSSEEEQQVEQEESGDSFGGMHGAWASHSLIMYLVYSLTFTRGELVTVLP